MKRLPVLLPQGDEHLVGAVEFLSVLQPHDVRLHQALDGAAQPHGVPLGHCLIGRVFGKQHTWRRRKHEVKSLPSVDTVAVVSMVTVVITGTSSPLKRTMLNSISKNVP